MGHLYGLDCAQGVKAGRRRPWLLAAVALAVLGPGFFLVYGACNAFTATREPVGSCYFWWERFIPFVPVMVIPYLSIDLFFSGSFFLCRDRAELWLLARRIALAIALSAAGFLLFPLRLGWARPPVDGFLGALLAPLNALDRPYNMCPSLHISLRAILWTVYGRHTRGGLRVGIATWFALIAMSTLLIYQHHFIDLVGGWLVAQACFFLCRAYPQIQPNSASSANSISGTAEQVNV